MAFQSQLARQRGELFATSRVRNRAPCVLQRGDGPGRLAEASRQSGVRYRQASFLPDGKSLLARAVVPTRKDRRWEIELAPLTRMQAWKVDPLEPGAEVGVLGFTFKDEKGDAVLRAEYLFVGGRVYGLRSSPA